MERETRDSEIERSHAPWLLDIRSVKCIVISLICHTCIMVAALLVMLFHSGSPAADEVSITCTEDFGLEKPQERFSDFENQERLEEQTTEAQESQNASKLLENLENEAPEVDSPNGRPTESTNATSEAERNRQNRSIDNDIQGRQGYGTLEPRTFYGMRIYAKNMVFVLDISGSMNIHEARRQLKNAYHSLGEYENFSIVVYADMVSVWEKSLQPATEENKVRADQWVDKLMSGGSTNFYGGLITGFNMACEIPYSEIYIVTDGRPNIGEIIVADQICADIRKRNHKKERKIHAIGIGMHQDKQFLQKLAEENYGSYLER